MLKIIICDDDDFTVRLIHGLLEKAIEISKIEAQIVCETSSGMDLLNFIKKNNGPCLYLLDFDFGKKDLNGIDLAKKISHYDNNAKIVFVTSHAEKGIAILQSGIQAFGFIEKDIRQQTMITSLIRCLKMAELSLRQIPESRLLELPVGIGETICLPASDIIYVDSVKTIAHSICYHTFNGSEITVRDTIEHALELLGTNFIRCHRSVIVNKEQVVSVKNSMVKLSNGTMVCCALGKRKEIVELCLEK